MRWFALFAVLANVLLAVWYFVIVKPAENRVLPQAGVEQSLVERPGLPTVQLLSEITDNEKAAKGVVPIAPVADREDKPAECLLVGPIPEKVTVLQLKERFGALGLDADFRAFQVKLEPVYWVYLPPYPSEEAAKKVLAGLRASGLDSFYVGDGEMKGGISLGVFSQESSAKQVHADRVAKGYPALLKMIPRSRKEIWAAFREPGSLADADYWRELAVDFPGIGRRTVSCGAVVSAEQLF